MNPSDEMRKITEKLGIGGIKRHILLCAGNKCCSPEEGQASWDTLKEWTRSEEGKALGVYRTKAACLRVCRDGPIAVVYPEGIWYRRVTSEVCRKIIDEHLACGRPVAEYQFAENPLPNSK